MLIDEMLEKPIDILDDKEECNFYTYEKIQIKRIRKIAVFNKFSTIRKLLNEFSFF
jgi:hypothetical protein